MGATHLATLLKLPDVVVKAAASRNERALSGDFSSIGGNLGRILPMVDLREVRKYGRWQDLVADPDVDAVDICLPTNLHSMVAKAALAAGKNVLCEKPMALDGEQCDEMIAAAEAAGRVLMIGHVLRFWPAYDQLAEFVTTARYGPVRSATFTRMCGLPEWSPWLADEAQSGGAILDLLIHDIDQVLRLFGMPTAVRAKGLGTLDAITASLLYPNGPEVRLQGGWLAPGTPFSMSFQVRAAAAELELRSSSLLLSDRRRKSACDRNE